MARLAGFEWTRPRQASPNHFGWWGVNIASKRRFEKQSNTLCDSDVDWTIFFESSLARDQLGLVLSFVMGTSFSILEIRYLKAGHSLREVSAG